ncbi:peptidase family M48-domain-containing protein [Dissophora ornata]|nr:peptidase family M48-domain-containing protein [Dissophora ornata]
MLNKIILRPQYKRFGQNPGPGGRGGGRGVPILFDRRFQIVGGVVAVGAGGYYVTHLETVPMTGRRRFMDVTPQQEEMMAKEAYKQVMSEFGHKMLPSNHPYTKYVERIAWRIIKAAGMENLDWEFHVIQSDEKNAFVLPGGKVFVFTGILPIAGNEDGLATVLGHEIAHQLARHSAEKLSFAKIAMFIGVIVAVVFDPSWSMQRIMMELGMMLPFSRKCETEADQIGLLLVAQACFDPRESIQMWARMASQEKGLSLAFLNTHPASKDRIHKLEQWMPEAMDTYNKSDCETTNAWADMFNKAKLASW